MDSINGIKHHVSVSDEFIKTKSIEGKDPELRTWVAVSEPFHGLPRSDKSRELEANFHKALSYGSSVPVFIEPSRDDATASPPSP